MLTRNIIITHYVGPTPSVTILLLYIVCVWSNKIYDLTKERLIKLNIFSILNIMTYSTVIHSGRV